MAVVAHLVRADLRRRWKAWAALAVLLAAAGGVSLFAITGWQRTSTAMDRFLDEFHPGDAIVEGIGVSSDPASVALALAVIVPASLLIALLVAAPSARSAARTRPAIALRTE